MSDRAWTSTSMPYLAPQEAGQGDVWAAEAAAKGGRGSQRIVHAGEVGASEEVAGLLGVEVGQAVVVRRRVIELDGAACELTDSYYPVAIARGTRLAGRGKIPGGAVALLAELGYRGVRVREDVAAGMPSPQERDVLRLGAGEPVLRVSRVTFDEGGRAVQADLIVMPGHRQRLRYEVRVG
ncbi:GntR family transcriptional regulator [Streptomyces griseoluteus]|uniref:GntR family transcriptional regulator n=1 Tax=Streptomyces griseoluteus TaxID=29306 RepID=UPI0036F8FCCD